MLPLGRAMVRNPAVFLLDEPLSNLDAKLRTSMRTEIIKLHQKLGTTFIYVTHDQTEAMTMGDRIVVMKDGLIQQVDTPQNLYDYPCNMFVGGFIGSPQMNFLDATLVKEGSNYYVDWAATSCSSLRRRLLPRWMLMSARRSRPVSVRRTSRTTRSSWRSTRTPPSPRMWKFPS